MITIIYSMRFLILILMPSFILLFSCSKVEDDELPNKDGLISFYNFQGNSDDVYGENSGRETNAIYVTDYFLHNNKVLILNGTNSYISIPESFDFEAKTINLWFNVLESSPVLGVIYSSDNPGLDYGLTLLNTQLVESHINLYFNVSNQQDTVEIKANTWYNATIVTMGKKYAYYLNGNPVKSGSFNSYVCSYNGNSSTIIGCDRTLTQRFFNGMVDNLLIYNRRLSDNEIKGLSKTRI
jgi:hypothetical protein